MSTPTPGQTHPVAVRVLARYADDWCAVVDYADQSSVVTRWHAGRPRPFRCADCGPQRTPTCAHLHAAVLAMQAQAALTQGARA